MSGLATGIAVGAAAQSAANSAKIAAEHLARCRTDIEDFRPEGASVERMKSYAECVQYMYPDPVSPESVPYIKAGVVLALVAFVVGAVWGWKEERSMVFAGIAAIMAPVVLGFVGLILFGIFAGIVYVLQ